MFDRNDCLEFLHKLIDVGVPNFQNHDHLFFYTGIETEVTEDEIKLKLSDGLKIIPIEKIVEIRLSRR